MIFRDRLMGSIVSRFSFFIPSPIIRTGLQCSCRNPFSEPEDTQKGAGKLHEADPDAGCV
jgi:hypothetical protein